MKGEPQGKNCPICSQPLDIDTYVPGQADTEPVKVQAGDVSFCFSCRTPLVINMALNPVVPDEDEMWEITHDPDFHRFVSMIDDARRSKPNMN